jgi:hypothetical protein
MTARRLFPQYVQPILAGFTSLCESCKSQIAAAKVAAEKVE